MLPECAPHMNTDSVSSVEKPSRWREEMTQVNSDLLDSFPAANQRIRICIAAFTLTVLDHPEDIEHEVSTRSDGEQRV
jgi:hypothetical protein